MLFLSTGVRNQNEVVIRVRVRVWVRVKDKVRVRVRVRKDQDQGWLGKLLFGAKLSTFRVRASEQDGPRLLEANSLRSSYSRLPLQRSI